MKRLIFDEFDSENKFNFKPKCKKYDFDICAFDYSIDKKQSKKSGIDIGTYTIINSPQMHELGNICYDYTQKLFKKYILKVLRLLGFNSNSNIFVVGLGNDKLLSDSLGRKVVDKVFMSRGLKKFNSTMSSVCGISPNIYANTGIETFDIINAVAKEIKPDIVLVVDSLATNSLSRLGRSFQVTTSSMEPGGAMESKNKILSKESLGFDCIFVGVPLIYTTNIDGKKTMFNDKDIDLHVRKCAKIISNSLNEIFFPSLSKNEIDDLLY